MNVIVMRDMKSYLENFARFEKDVAQNGQAWLNPIRQAAIGRFSELGFPTTRDEDWRFTNVTAIARTPFQLPNDGRAELVPQDLDPFVFPGLECSQIIFVNGRYSPELSNLLPLPNGVRIASLAQALTSDRSLIEPHLAQYADYQRDTFSALNTAFMYDGAFVYITKSTVLREPIHILYISTPTADPLIIHPRNLIVMDEDSQATIVEDYASLGSDVYFSNVVTEAIVGENSVLSYYFIERESRKAFNISTLRIQQGRSSNVVTHSVMIGGALVRSNVHPVLAGEGGECIVNGLFLSTGRQHMDNYMRVEHASPHCNSRQLYKGILDGKSHGVFHGRIIVHKNAQKTDAKQTNKNLLLSDEAQIDTKPQLEIYADDVKCTHGATIGQMDRDAIFYLRSRGISEESARALLLLAFADENLQRMKVEPIRRHLEGIVAQWFNREKLSEGVS
ncbi:MAG: Fe-S cluster assembly protein SufD [Candidatus Dadabacteria bacterium]